VKFRRINLFGGPAVGKSTQAAGIFHHLKQRGYKVELVSEIAKLWAYQCYRISSFDQVYLCAAQMHTEDTFLRDGRSDFIVSDSPVLLTIVYARFYELECWRELFPIAAAFEREFPSLNIVIRRVEHHHNYTTTGRYQSPEEARKVDALVLQCLDMAKVPHIVLPSSEVISHVLERINESPQE